MKNSKHNLPVMAIESLYAFAGKNAQSLTTSTGTDNTTTCTTVLTTTRLDRR